MMERPNAALRRLGVSQKSLRQSPSLSAILKETKGGIALAIEAMRFADSPLIQDFLSKYDSVPSGDRERLPIEAIAIAAEIDVRHLLGEIMIAIREHNGRAAALIAIDGHPEVMKKRVEFAQLPGGTRDRDALDTMLGALPTPKTTFIGRLFVGSPAQAAGSQEPEAPQKFDEDLDNLFPDCSVMQERVQPMRQKLLEK